MQQEIQGVQVGELITLDLARDHPLEVPCHAGRRHLLHEDGVVLWLQRDQPHVRRVTLVTGSGVREVEEADDAPFPFPSFRLSILPSSHTSTISTHGSTIRLSRRAGQYATISSGFGRPPANPVTLGGPLRMSGAISRVKRSTGALSCERTPMRSWTSGRSSSGALARASVPCVASAPTNSVRIASNLRPRAASRCRSTRSAAWAFLYASGQAYTSVPTALYP